LPDAIGGYKIQAAGAPPANGERILLGEDVVLGSRVILHLTPATPEGDEQERARFQVSRPARLRVLGSGTVLINDQVFDWVAYVAPTGVPLIDSIDPAHRLAWCQSRSIIEQLAEELATAEAEGTLPETLSVQQVWVEPNGHAQLLDFIVPAIDAPPRGPLPRSDERNAGLKLLAKVATLTLEGQARDPDAEPGSIRAAIPLHAEKRINPLVGDGNRYASVAAFRDSMRARMQEPDEVTSIHRFGQIGVMTGFLAIGLVVMFIATGLHDFVQWLTRWESAWASGWVITQYKTEEGKSTLARLEPELSKKMNDPKFRQKFEERFNSDANRAKELRDDLRRGPRAFARTVEEAGRDYEPEPHILTELIARTEKPPKSERGWLEDTPFLKSPRQQTLALVFVWPVLWTIGAYLLKGGPSMPLTGLALRRRDGKKPSRERYALRAWIVWFPVALLLAGSVLIPGFAILWWFALALVMGYALCAIMFPERPQHDRLLGLEVVPR